MPLCGRCRREFTPSDEQESRVYCPECARTPYTLEAPYTLRTSGQTQFVVDGQVIGVIDDFQHEESALQPATLLNRREPTTSGTRIEAAPHLTPEEMRDIVLEVVLEIVRGHTQQMISAPLSMKPDPVTEDSPTEPRKTQWDWLIQDEE